MNFNNRILIFCSCHVKNSFKTIIKLTSILIVGIEELEIFFILMDVYIYHFEITKQFFNYI